VVDEIDERGEASLRQHFMASGNFGRTVLTLTLLSTIFSGYIVVRISALEDTVVGHTVLHNVPVVDYGGVRSGALELLATSTTPSCPPRRQNPGHLDDNILSTSITSF
jgi:hypothetical protein